MRSELDPQCGHDSGLAVALSFRVRASVGVTKKEEIERVFVVRGCG